MQALWVEDGQVTLREMPFARAAGECAVRVTLTGICGTDLQLLQGYAGFRGIPGHEFVGVVEEAPSGDVEWIGRRVVASINVGCGACEWCAASGPEHCPSRTVVGIRDRAGSFAERVSVPASNLFEVPRAISDRVAVFVEPVAAACRILEQVPVSADTRVAVLGDGRLGLVIAQVLRTVSKHVLVVGRHEEKLALARTLGLDVATPRQCRRHASFDVVVDATGRASGLNDALALVRPRGVVVLKSTIHGEAAVALWPAIVHEVTLVGSRCGPFAAALRQLERGAVAVEPLISGVFRLHDHPSAFDAARRQLKILFTTS
jgi:alcohol dehydrogenase